MNNHSLLKSRQHIHLYKYTRPKILCLSVCLSGFSFMHVLKHQNVGSFSCSDHHSDRLVHALKLLTTARSCTQASVVLDACKWRAFGLTNMLHACSNLTHRSGLPLKAAETTNFVPQKNQPAPPTLCIQRAPAKSGIHMHGPYQPCTRLRPIRVTV